MGQTIGWYKWDGKEKHWDRGVPPWFDAKWDGTWEWFIAIFDASPQEVDKDTHTGDSLFRPGDFAAFRAKLAAITTDSERLADYEVMTAYLEAHPDTYVNFG